MGALLSIPLLAVPSMGTVRPPKPVQNSYVDTDFCRSWVLWRAAAVQLHALRYAVRVGSVGTGPLTPISRVAEANRQQRCHSNCLCPYPPHQLNIIVDYAHTMGD